MLNPHQIHNHVYNEQDHKLALKFAKELQGELDVLLKEVVFFGSAAKREGPIKAMIEHDIDVLVLLDDLKKVLSNEVQEAYRIITEQVARRVTTRLHINTLKLSSLWEFLASGDPIALNILREGKPLLNAGLITPLQELLKRGQIRPTKENVWVYFHKAPQTLMGAQWHILQATIDLYWAALDATHAALLTLNQTPSHPDDAEHMLKNTLIAHHGFAKQHLKTLQNLRATMQRIQDRDLKMMPGKAYDHLYKETKDYIGFTKRWIADFKAKV